jgi:histone H3/H4
MAVLDVLDVERLIRKAGADRVSEEAGYALSEVLEEKAIAIAERALRIAKYAHKRTVTRKDIELALMYEQEATELAPVPVHAKASPKPKPMPLAI